MAANTAISVLFLLMAILCMQASAGDLCDIAVPFSARGSFLTRTCVYNGCYGCYSEHVSAELDQNCKDHYKGINNFWQSYKCCGYTANQCPTSSGGPWRRGIPSKRFARRQQQHDA
ncbi:hypothetical protein ACROYT_G031701 [Oculina patagonica]